jgi:methylmalonyl-CoA mutase N-terminal domain/subunit
MDETLALPSEKAVKLALRTQQIIAHEILAGLPMDPLGGSYYVEAVTDAMEQGAEEYFQKIDALGGVVPAIEAGFFQREIARAAFTYQQEIERRERIIVGINDFVEDGEEIAIPILKIEEDKISGVQSRKLAALRKRRDAKLAQECLDNIKEAAEKGENIMPHLIAGAHALCTLGEMVRILSSVYSEYEEPAFF